jgi:single-strand DNA-binding protein
LRQTPTGQNVTSFSLALNRSYKDQSGEWQEATDYIDIVCWGPLAERVAQYLSKGRRCLVQGRLQSRSWEQDGQKRSKVEVLANDVTFLDSRGEGGEGGGNFGGGSSSDDAPAHSKPKPTKKPKKDDVVIEDIGDEPINLDDIPF